MTRTARSSHDAQDFMTAHAAFDALPADSANGRTLYRVVRIGVRAARTERFVIEVRELGEFGHEMRGYVAGAQS